MGIVLLGYRGSGKTTVARLLATELHLKLIDTDAEIVAEDSRSIREIFEQSGESAFRDLEQSAVVRALTQDQVVIALGGGAVLREATRAALTRSSLHRFYLRCDARVLHHRIHADPLTAQSRPSLTHLGGSLAEIEHLLAAREPLYRAVMTDELDVTHLLPESAAAAIVEIAESTIPKQKPE